MREAGAGGSACAAVVPEAAVATTTTANRPMIRRVRASMTFSLEAFLTEVNPTTDVDHEVG